MTDDWAFDVKKYAPEANDAVIAAIVRYCGIALRSRDGSLISFTEPSETARVRENFLKKKLALTDPDATLDAAIAAVGDRMGGDTTRNRVTVYYLLAEHFGKLGIFGAGSDRAEAAPVMPAQTQTQTTPSMATEVTSSLPPEAMPSIATEATPSIAAGVAPSMATEVTSSLAAEAAPSTNAEGAMSMASAAAPVVATPAAPLMAAAAPPIMAMQPAPTAAGHAAPAQSRRGVAATGWGDYLPLAVLVVGGVGILSLLGRRELPEAPAPAPIAAEMPAAPVAPAIPTGAGVVAAAIDGEPMVSVYFDTAKADIDPGFEATTAELRAYAAAHPGDHLQVSGFNDPRGDAAFNAELSKNRAFAVRDALVKLGVDAARIDLVKPADTSDDRASLANARRVDVTVEAGPVPAAPAA